MMVRPIFKATISIFLTALWLGGCNGSKSESEIGAEKTSQSDKSEPVYFPSLETTLNCLPKNAAIMASHRGTSRNWDAAENSVSGLKRLIKAGYLVAEIDVASTKDNVLFTFHDGVFDHISTGKGPVASANSDYLETIILETRNGKLTSDRPAFFSEILDLAKDKIYLEIDFKSSAKYEDVIQVIRDNDMSDQVVLIAYTDGQANKLARLAPDMLLSVPPESAKTGQLIWFGENADTAPDLKSIIGIDPMIIGRVRRKTKTRNLDKMVERSTLIVTDFVDEYDPIIGLKDKAEYKACRAADRP